MENEISPFYDDKSITRFAPPTAQLLFFSLHSLLVIFHYATDGLRCLVSFRRACRLRAPASNVIIGRFEIRPHRPGRAHRPGDSRSFVRAFDKRGARTLIIYRVENCKLPCPTRLACAVSCARSVPCGLKAPRSPPTTIASCYLFPASTSTAAAGAFLRRSGKQSKRIVGNFVHAVRLR